MVLRVDVGDDDDDDGDGNGARDVQSVVQFPPSCATASKGRRESEGEGRGGEGRGYRSSPLAC